MLINKDAGYTPGDIVAFKLANGDECVAKVVESNGLNVVVSKPLTVIPSAKGIAMVQSLFTAEIDRNITISHQHIIMHAPVAKEVKDYYLERTTGIELAKPGMVV